MLHEYIILNQISEIKELKKDEMSKGTLPIEILSETNSINYTGMKS